MSESKTDHQTKLSCNQLARDHEFSDGFLKQLADRILACQQECARVQGELTPVRDEEIAG